MMTYEISPSIWSSGPAVVAVAVNQYTRTHRWCSHISPFLFYLYIRRVIVTIKSATSITSKSYFWAREEFQSKCATKWLKVYWSSCFCLCVHFVLAAGNVVLVAGNAVLAGGGLAAVPW